MQPRVLFVFDVIAHIEYTRLELGREANSELLARYQYYMHHMKRACACVCVRVRARAVACACVCVVSIQLRTCARRAMRKRTKNIIVCTVHIAQSLTCDSYNYAHAGGRHLHSDHTISELHPNDRVNDVRNRRLGKKTEGSQPGIQAQRPRTRTARTTRQINGAKSFSG